MAGQPASKSTEELKGKTEQKDRNDRMYQKWDEKKRGNQRKHWKNLILPLKKEDVVNRAQLMGKAQHPWPEGGKLNICNN